MLAPSETDLEMCPDCGMELVTRLGEIGEVADINVKGYIFPVHYKPMTAELCLRGGQPVNPLPTAPMPEVAVAAP